jgi:hypothetical protein
MPEEGADSEHHGTTLLGRDIGIAYSILTRTMEVTAHIPQRAAIFI